MERISYLGVVLFSRIWKSRGGITMVVAIDSQLQTNFIFCYVVNDTLVYRVKIILCNGLRKLFMYIVYKNYLYEEVKKLFACVSLINSKSVTT